MNLLSRLNDVQLLLLYCMLLGDSGKGKVADLLAQLLKIDGDFRGNGGGNAGHTIVINDVVYVFNLIPSAILHKDVVNVIGSGVAVNPRQLLMEIDRLESAGVSTKNLRIAHNAHLVLPQHILVDRLAESGTSKIGTTGTGMGPTYSDFYARFGLTVNDLLNRKVFEQKFRRNLERHMPYINSFEHDVVRTILSHPVLGGGKYSVGNIAVKISTIIEDYLAMGERLRPYIDDTDSLARDMMRQGKRILLEGAQGNLLSIHGGTYPYVTSSNATIPGIAEGVGLDVRDVQMSLGLIKVPYATRVGHGAFPTELGGTDSEIRCNSGLVNKKTETDEHSDATLSDNDPFKLGIAVRQAGNEYGATTGRPRRVGWMDLPLLRYSRNLVPGHGSDVAFMKLDVLSHCPTIQVCVGYTYNGDSYNIGQKVLKPGDTLTTAIPADEVLRKCTPIYRTFPGWMSDISHIRRRADLPARLQEIMEFTESELGSKALLLSVGADREQTILE